jgi:hypothetical protein
MIISAVKAEDRPVRPPAFRFTAERENDPPGTARRAQGGA